MRWHGAGPPRGIALTAIKTASADKCGKFITERTGCLRPVAGRTSRASLGAGDSTAHPLPSGASSTAAPQPPGSCMPGATLAYNRPLAHAKLAKLSKASSQLRNQCGLQLGSQGLAGLGLHPGATPSQQRSHAHPSLVPLPAAQPLGQRAALHGFEGTGARPGSYRHVPGGPDPWADEDAPAMGPEGECGGEYDDADDALSLVAGSTSGSAGSAPGSRPARGSWEAFTEGGAAEAGCAAASRGGWPQQQPLRAGGALQQPAAQRRRRQPLASLDCNQGELLPAALAQCPSALAALRSWQHPAAVLQPPDSAPPPLAVQASWPEQGSTSAADERLQAARSSWRVKPAAVGAAHGSGYMKGAFRQLAGYGDETTGGGGYAMHAPAVSAGAFGGSAYKTGQDERMRGAEHAAGGLPTSPDPGAGGGGWAAAPSACSAMLSPATGMDDTAALYGGAFDFL